MQHRAFPRAIAAKEQRERSQIELNSGRDALKVLDRDAIEHEEKLFILQSHYGGLWPAEIKHVVIVQSKTLVSPSGSLQFRINAKFMTESLQPGRVRNTDHLDAGGRNLADSNQTVVSGTISPQVWSRPQEQANCNPVSHGGFLAGRILARTCGPRINTYREG